MDQSRRNRRINSAGKTENDPVAADLTADPVNGILDDLARGPLPGAAADLADKRIDQHLAARGMIHLGMKLDAVEIPVDILDRTDRGIGCSGNRLETGRNA